MIERQILSVSITTITIGSFILLRRIVIACGLWIISFVMTHAEVAKPNRVYLANPLGFSEAGSEFIRRVLLPELTNRGFQVINPFDLVDLSKIREIQAMPIGSARIDAWKALNAVIGKTNQETIDSCDVVLAVLDGTDVDSGTAAEIGYAYARGKKIMGYRGDFRLSADNEGSSVNLQVEYFIRSSGGTVVTKSSDIGDAMWALVKKN